MMDADKYQAMAMVTAKELPKKDALVHFALLATSESGEAADAVKKHVVYGKDLDAKNLREEIGDMMWAAAYGCELMGWKISEVMEENILKLQRRYPGGSYSDQDAHARADKA